MATFEISSLRNPSKEEIHQFGFDRGFIYGTSVPTLHPEILGDTSYVAMLSKGKQGEVTDIKSLFFACASTAESFDRTLAGISDLFDFFRKIEKDLDWPLFELYEKGVLAGITLAWEKRKNLHGEN